MLWIGLISGTSADGIDAALVDVGTSPRDLSLRAFCTLPLDEALRARIHEASRDRVALRDLVGLDVELGERFAQAAHAVADEAGVPLGDVAGIGSHGQTVGHYPEPGVHGTLQIGCAAVLHARTGVPVVSDFRRLDMAVGGQGAPLTPFLHLTCLSDPAERRAVLNVGGFTNLTWLGGDDPEAVIAFDPGPGNALIDRAVRWASEGAQRFDADGARCARGKIFGEVLASLLEDPYFDAPPPKSTGHEHFGAAFFERARDAILRDGGSPDDVCATLCALTVESVARAAERHLPAAPGRWLVYGGGVHNAALLDGLRARLSPAPVETTDRHGLPCDALEAICFAVLGWCHAQGRPSNLPAATGASRAVCLGARTGTRTG